MQFLQIPDMFYEECHHPVSNSVSCGFEENISPPVYDDQEGDVQEEGHANFLCEECNQHAANFFNIPKGPTVYNKRLDHLEEAEDPKGDVS